MHHQDEGLGCDLADQGADATWPMMGLAELWKMARLVGTVTGDPRDCASEGVMGQHHYQKVLGEAREVCAEGAGVAGNAGRSVADTPAPTPSGHRPPAAAESVLPCPSLLRVLLSPRAPPRCFVIVYRSPFQLPPGQRLYFICLGFLGILCGI